MEQKLSKQQREHLLGEQLKAIKKELGIEKDDKEALLSKFREAIEGIQKRTTVPASADEQLQRLCRGQIISLQSDTQYR